MRTKLILLLALLALYCSGAWAGITQGNYYIRNAGMSTNLYLSSSATCVAKESAQAFLISPVDGENGYYTISCLIAAETKYLKFYEGTDYKMQNENDNTTVKLDGTSSSDDACKWKITSQGANEKLQIWPKGHESGTTAPRVLIQFSSTAGKCAGLWNSTTYGGSNWALTAYNTSEEQVFAGTLSSEIEVEVAGTTGTFSRTGGGNSNWMDLWTSFATGLKVQITTPTENSAYRYCMAWTGLTQQIQMASGQDNNTAYYTITAPYGWLITGYKINGTTNGNLTIDLADDTSPEYAQGATLSNVGVTGLSTKQSSFTLRGANKVITGTLHIKMKRSVMSLSDISTTKCYTLSTKDDRGYMYVPAGETKATTTSKVGVSKDQSSAAQQFAFIYYDGTDNSVDDGKYYLYSVSEKKFISKDGSYTKLTRTAEDYVTIEMSDINNYLRIKFNGSNRINFSGGYTYAIFTGWEGVDDGNRLLLDEAGDFDPTDALDTWNTRDVTYELYFNDSKINELLVVGEHFAAAEIPAALDNGFMTYTYTPSNITSETSTVRIDATWNGPFQYTASYTPETVKWYTISMHLDYISYNCSWKYNSGTGKVSIVDLAIDNYSGITDDRLFCFVGNPYDGFQIYNKQTGDSKKLRRSDEIDEIAMSDVDDNNVFVLSKSTSNSNATIYFCIKPSSQTNYLNMAAEDVITGSASTGASNTCWVVTPSNYPLNFLNGQVLDAPYGAVGTKAGLTVDDYAKANEYREYFRTNPFGYATYSNIQRGEVDGVLNKFRDGAIITLANGYYRVISAIPGFNHTAAWYYNPGNDASHVTWAKAATSADHQINSIFKFEGSESSWNIKSPNAQQSVAASEYAVEGNAGWGKQSCKLGEAGTITVSSIGSAQWTLKNYTQTMCANNHGEGANASGTIINWNANTVGGASAWYIVPVSSINLVLNDGGDGYYYATMCMPFDVTLSEACAYTLTLNGAKDGLTLSSALDEVSAGTPVPLRHTVGNVTAFIANNALTGAPITSTALTGVYVNTAVNGATDYFLGKAGDPAKIGFCHWVGNTLNANRAYFEKSNIPGEVKAFYGFDFEDGETGIGRLAPTFFEGAGTAIYNLSGQRLNKMQKGINIVNGKKVLF